METTKIVLFEDEFLLANDLKRQLTQYGYEVTAMFKKAEEGLAYLSAADTVIPDVVLMDISLAGKMSGLEAALIIANEYNCALVFLTGLSQFEVFEEAFKSKPFAFLLKPFDVQQAIVSIKLAVYQKKLETQLRRYQEKLEEIVHERTLELEKARDKAEEAIKLKNTFLSNISNQIREPMYGILGISAMMKEEIKDKPQLQRHIQYIDDNARHLFSLLNKIAELSNEYNTKLPASGNSAP
jgi:DNA-binding NtrC family response regulator